MKYVISMVDVNYKKEPLNKIEEDSVGLGLCM